MGWTSYNANHYNSKGNVDVLAEVNSILNWENDTHKCEVLKSSRHGSTVYSAVKSTNKTNGFEAVWAAIFLTSVNNKNYYNFSYKDMDETCGPYYYDCPKSILDLLTPTTSEYANNWRNACRENIEKKAEQRKNGTSLDQLPYGAKIETVWDGNPLILTKEVRHRKGVKSRWVDKDGYYLSKASIERRGYKVL